MPYRRPACCLVTFALGASLRSVAYKLLQSYLLILTVQMMALPVLAKPYRLVSDMI